MQGDQAKQPAPSQPKPKPVQTPAAPVENNKDSTKVPKFRIIEQLSPAELASFYEGRVNPVEFRRPKELVVKIELPLAVSFRFIGTTEEMIYQECRKTWAKCT